MIVVSGKTELLRKETAKTVALVFNIWNKDQEKLFIDAITNPKSGKINLLKEFFSLNFVQQIEGILFGTSLC